MSIYYLFDLKANGPQAVARIAGIKAVFYCPYVSLASLLKGTQRGGRGHAGGGCEYQANEWLQLSKYPVVLKPAPLQL